MYGSSSLQFTLYRQRINWPVIKYAFEYKMASYNESVGNEGLNGYATSELCKTFRIALFFI